jgi:hypothetical protein
MNRVFQQAYHITGTLSADAAIRFTAPFDCQLVHVSAVASNDSDATLKIGTSSDDDTYLTACTIGDSGTPAEQDRDDFVGTQYPHVTDGTIVVLTLDHDGDSGTAAADVTLVLTFTEG